MSNIDKDKKDVNLNKDSNKRKKFDYKDAKTLLKVNHLSQYFKLERKYLKAVDDISFDVKEGEVFGLVGESGSGKTTTGRSIIGLYDITGGDVYFDNNLINAGMPMRKAAIKEARKAGDSDKVKELKAEMKEAKEQVKENRDYLHENIQMIFQDPVSSLDPRMTVREIIAEGLTIQGETDKDLINKKVDRVLNEVGLLTEHADRYPHEFSGGQRQRIGIARAIVMEPRMIIADEPVSALDVSIQAQIINLLDELRNKRNLTIMFIAHDLAVVKYISDRIAVMYSGKLVELTTSDDLFARPLHPYTRSLLSAIPSPDPHTERSRVRVNYEPALEHDYSEDKPSMREVFKDHYVYCNDAEEAKYLAEYPE